MRGMLTRLNERAERLGTRGTLARLLIVFALSRLAAFALGVRFDATPLDCYIQCLDPALLRDDLWTSLFCLHAQPPLFNLFLGTTLKLAPDNAPILAQDVYLALGAALYACMYLLMVRLGVPALLRLALVLWLMLNPASVLYENWLFYDFPVACLLVFAALLLHRLAHRPGFGAGLAFFGVLAALALTRSLFHLAWLLLWVAIVAWRLRPRWKTVLAAAALPALLVCAWYAKNAVVFGAFTASTWLGMNFARITTCQLTPDERQAEISAGRLSSLALIPPFASPYEYALRRPPPAWPHHPALDQQRKSNGCVNFNCRDYIHISRQYWEEAARVAVRHPGRYFQGVCMAYFYFFLPASQYDLTSINRSKMRSWDRLFNALCAGQLSAVPTARSSSYGLENLSWLIVVAYFVAFAGGAMGLRRLRRASGPEAGPTLLSGETRRGTGVSHVPESAPTFLVVLFLWLGICCVAGVGNALEVGENMRFRFLAEPLMLMLLGWLFSRTWPTAIE